MRTFLKLMHLRVLTSRLISLMQHQAPTYEANTLAQAFARSLTLLTYFPQKNKKDRAGMECNIAILCLDQLNNFTAVLLDQFWFVLEIFCPDRLLYLDLAAKLTMFCGRILGAISMVKSCKWDAACFHKADSAWCVSEQNHLQLLHGQTMPGIFIRTPQRRRGGQNSLVVRPWSGLPALGGRLVCAAVAGRHRRDSSPCGRSPMEPTLATRSRCPVRA